MCVCVKCIISGSTDTQTHVDARPEIDMVPLLPPQKPGSGRPSGLGQPWRCLTPSFITQPLASGTGVLALHPQAAWLPCRRRGMSAAWLQFGSTADGLVPNKPPKSADVLKAADTDGSALILPFSRLQERRERGRETKAEINSFVTELCSFTRQDKAAVQVGCRWDQLSTVCLILYGLQ